MKKKILNKLNFDKSIITKLEQRYTKGGGRTNATTIRPPDDDTINLCPTLGDSGPAGTFDCCQGYP